MSQNETIKTLSAASDMLITPLPKGPTQFILALDLFTATAKFAAFVGTVKIQWSADEKTWTDGTVIAVASSGATAANPTAVGNFASLLDVTAIAARVFVSAYTSGGITARTHLIQVAA